MEYAIGILRKEHEKLLSALADSSRCCKEKTITLDEHQKHIKNLLPKIKELRDAILILKTHAI